MRCKEVVLCLQPIDMLIFDCLRTIIIVYFCNRNMITLDEHIEEVFYAMVEARLKRVRRMSLAEAREESLQLLMEACYANSGTRRLYEMVAAALEEVERCEDEGCEEEPRSSWEESIPEWLRTGKLGVAWSELRRDGVLREDYQLTEKKAAVAYRLVEGFHQAWEDLNGRKRNKPWRCFEDFWGFEHLKTRGGSISKELETVITKIFREL